MHDDRTPEDQPDRSDQGQPGRAAAPGIEPGSWRQLLHDLESEFEGLIGADEAAERADEVRVALGRLRLIERLAAAREGGSEARLVLADTTSWSGRVHDVGPDWVLLAHERAQSVLVPLGAVAAVVVPSGHVRLPGDGEVWRRFGLRRILARLARDRAVADLGTVGQRWRGRLEAVGEDHVLLAPVPPGEWRPQREELVVVALHHLTSVVTDLAVV